MTRALWILGIVCLVGCGDPLQSTGYQGEPRFVVEGTVTTDFGDRLPPTGRYRVNLFWHPENLSIDRIVESATDSVDVTALGGFRMWFFQEPTSHTIRNRPYALGAFYVYRDANENGRRDVGEAIFGADRQAAVVWSPEGVPEDDRMLVHAVPPGYQLVRLPLRCGADLTPSAGAVDDAAEQPSGTVTCNARVGSECLVDGDCGQGICTDQLVGASIGRTCTLPITPEFPPCTPSDALIVPASGATFDRLAAATTWARACGVERPCLQRDDHCAPGIGICLPPPRVQVEMEASVEDFALRDLEICLIDRFRPGTVPDGFNELRWPWDFY